MSISSIGDKLEEALLSSKKKILGSVVIVISLLSIPVTLSLVYQQQDLRQRAATSCDASALVTETHSCDPSALCGGQNQGNCQSGLYCKNKDAYGNILPSGLGICCTTGKFYCPSTGTCTYLDSCSAGPTVAQPTPATAQTAPAGVIKGEVNIKSWGNKYKNIDVYSVELNDQNNPLNGITPTLTTINSTEYNIDKVFTYTFSGLEPNKKYGIIVFARNTLNDTISMSNNQIACPLNKQNSSSFSCIATPGSIQNFILTIPANCPGAKQDMTLGLGPGAVFSGVNGYCPETHPVCVAWEKVYKYTGVHSGQWFDGCVAPGSRSAGGSCGVDVDKACSKDNCYYNIQNVSGGGGGLANAYILPGICADPYTAPVSTNTPTPTATPVPPTATPAPGGISATTAPVAATATTAPTICDPVPSNGTIDGTDLLLARNEVLGNAQSHLASCMTDPATDATTGTDVLKIRNAILGIPN